MIEVTNLTKRYGDQTAVDHLSFRVEKGQIYGFLGPNGAGKSTTMNIITGYLAATEGTVVIDGKDIQKEPEEAKKKERIKQTEERISALEEEESQINASLADPAVLADYKKVNALFGRLLEIKNLLDALYTEYSDMI